jgi:MSHA biogenesis protein MshO
MMRAADCNAHARQRGFTMVEMVVSLVVSSVLMGMIAMIIGAPVDRYMEQRRRGELVDASDSITRMLTADLARALPNSVRIGNSANISVLQMLEVTDVAYYVVEPPLPNAAQALEGLNFTNGDQFTAYGRFDGPRRVIPPSRPWLIMGHSGIGASNAYSPANNIRVMNAVPAPAPAMNGYPITLDAGFRFGSSSATNRLFVVRAPITYVCNRATGRLQRFTDHAIGAATPANEAAAQLNSPGTVVTTLATGVTSCNVACPLANARCDRTVTLSVTLSRGVAPNISTLRVFQQAAVENTT